MDPIDMMTTDYNCEYLGLSRLCLMENAGKSLSDEVATLSTFKFSKPVKILIFTGSGGNGGDGFVAARHLLNRGFEVEVYCLNTLDEIKSDDALVNLEILMNMEPRVSRLSVKVAVDAPSGLDPLTGEISDIAVEADYTVSFHKIKTGVKLAGEEKTGGVITCDIGIPIEAELFVEGGDLLRLKNRKNDSHKGNNGKVLIVGGSKDYYGAPAISAKAAIATGVDLTYIYTPKNAALPIKSFSEDFIVQEAKGDYLSLEDLDDILELASKVDAVLLGPGSSQMEETGKLFNVLAMKIDKPLVLDADALKLVDLSLVSKKEDLIITPHLSEFKSFFKNASKEDLDNLEKFAKLDDKENLDFRKVNDKIDAIHKITKSINGSVILKGKYDFIFNGNRLKINRTGNPGMTVGGTGDALAGICLSLLSQGLNSFDAALLAPYLNGKAGDLAYEAQGYGFGAQDLTQYLGAVMSGLIE